MVEDRFCIAALTPFGKILYWPRCYVPCCIESLAKVFPTRADAEKFLPYVREKWNDLHPIIVIFRNGL